MRQRVASHQCSEEWAVEEGSQHFSNPVLSVLEFDVISAESYDYYV